MEENFILEESSLHLTVLRLIADLELIKKNNYLEDEENYDYVLKNFLLYSNDLDVIFLQDERIAGIISKMENYNIVYLLMTPNIEQEQDTELCLFVQSYCVEIAEYIYKHYLEAIITPIYFVSYDLGCTIAEILEEKVQVVSQEAISLAPFFAAPSFENCISFQDDLISKLTRKEANEFEYEILSKIYQLEESESTKNEFEENQLEENQLESKDSLVFDNHNNCSNKDCIDDVFIKHKELEQQNNNDDDFVITYQDFMKTISMRLHEILTIEELLETTTNDVIFKLEPFLDLIYHKAVQEFKAKYDIKFINEFLQIYSSLKTRKVKTNDINLLNNDELTTTTKHKDHANDLLENYRNRFLKVKITEIETTTKKNGLFDTISRVFSNEKNKKEINDTRTNTIDTLVMEDYFDNQVEHFFHFIKTTTTTKHVDYENAIMLLFIKNCLKVSQTEILSCFKSDFDEEEELLSESEEKQEEELFLKLSSLGKINKNNQKDLLSDQLILFYEMNHFMDSCIPINYIKSFIVDQRLCRIALYYNINHLFSFLIEQSKNCENITCQKTIASIKNWNGVLYIYEEKWNDEILVIEPLLNSILTQLSKLSKRSIEYWQEKLNITQRPHTLFVFWNLSSSTINFEPDLYQCSLQPVQFENETINDTEQLLESLKQDKDKLVQLSKYLCFLEKETFKIKQDLKSTIDVLEN